jgi:iron(III) transport system substrate-binding protein
MRNKLLATAALISFVVAFSAVAGTTPKGANEVNLCSYCQEFLIKPLLDAFTRQTGVAVPVVSATTGMLERLKAEGRNIPVDTVSLAEVA